MDRETIQSKHDVYPVRYIVEAGCTNEGRTLYGPWVNKADAQVWARKNIKESIQWAITVLCLVR